MLEDQPDYAAAQQNAEVVEQEIARRLQQEPPPQDSEGDPQDSEGDPQDSEGDPQDSEGDPQDSEGEPQDSQGDPQDPQDDPQDPQGDPQDSEGDPQEPTDGTRAPSEEEPDTGLPGDLDGMQADGSEPGEDTPQLDAARSGARPGEITAEEAARMVDAVEEGQPRVVARPGAAGDKDW